MASPCFSNPLSLIMFSKSIDKNVSAVSNGYIARMNEISHNARLYLLFVLLTALNVGIYGVIFNLYILRLGFKEDFLGLILSLSSTSIGVFAIPAALVCDRLGRKRTLLYSTLLLALSLLFLYNTSSGDLLALFSIVYGISMALSIIAGGTFMVENSGPYERMHLFSAYYIIYAISTLSGNLIGGFIPDLLVGIGPISSDPSFTSPYRLTLYISLAATIISILPLIFIEEDGKGTLEVAKRVQFDVFKSIAKSRIIRRMALVYSLCGIGWGISLPYFNVYFDVALKASASQIGLIFSISQLAMVVGYFLVPMLTERMGKVRLASSVQILSIPFLLVFVFTSSIIVAAFGYVVRNVLMNMANPAFNSFKLEIVSPEERSMMNSVTWMACYTFVGLGTYAGGIIMAGGHNTMPFLIAGIFYGLMAIAYYLYFWKIERGKDQ